jgi:hypothetical protein
MLDPVHGNLLKIIRDYLLEGTQSTRNIKIEPYELNVYGAHLIIIHLHLIRCCCPGEVSFFKPHFDTPQSEKMFGSLVIVFPTPMRAELYSFVTVVVNGPLTLAGHLIARKNRQLITWHSSATSNMRLHR